MARVSGGAVPRFVQVRCPAGNRRRAGHAFDATFQVFAEGEIDGEELALLVKDPALEVQASGDGESYVTIVSDDVPEVSAIVEGPGAGDSSAIELLNEDIDRLEKDIEEVNGKLSTANSTISSLTSERDGLRNKVLDLEAREKTLTGERDEAVEAHKRVVDQLTAAQARIVELGGPAPGERLDEGASDVTEPPVKAAKQTKTDKAQAKS